MEGIESFGSGLFLNSDVEEEFRSCCEDEEWQDTEEYLCECLKEDSDDEFPSQDDELSSQDDVDESAIRMFFKGVSASEGGDSGSKVSGIGVVMERSNGVPVIQVQKKLDFFVDKLVAEHLALLDGLIEAQRIGVERVFAFTDSEEVYQQIAEVEPLEDRLLVALGYRILEHVNKLEAFVLKLVPRSNLVRPLRLAQEMVGIVDWLVDDCSICCEEKQQSQIIKLKCSHTFCLDCMVMYVERKSQALQVPMLCPQVKCKYYISTSEFKSFLPLSCYESLERTTMEAGILTLDKIFCPFPECSVLLRPNECSSSSASSSSQSEINHLECSRCHRLVCTSCWMQWHSSMSCEEYRSLPAEERDAGDITLHQLAQNNNWRHCRHCSRMIERTEGCYHMTCWCGHEFCYSCGVEYQNGAQICQCAFWDDDDENSVPSEPSTPSIHEANQWRCEPFNLPAITDGYSEQERAQLALFQRFLAGGFGGFGLSDDHQYYQCQSPPRCSDSYLDAIKDLHQLPWLERFVSVISDSYHEDYIQ